MNNELVAKCQKLIPDRRTLSVLVAKRARMLARGSRPLCKTDMQSHLDIALHEISEGLLEAEKPKETKKDRDNRDAE